jgi:hypothetical protein
MSYINCIVIVLASSAEFIIREQCSVRILARALFILNLGFTWFFVRIVSQARTHYRFLPHTFQCIIH